MAITITLHHDRHFDLLADTDFAEAGLPSLGQFDVETRGGTEVRQKVQMDRPGNVTTVELPDDFDTSPRSLMNLVETLTERHSAEEDVHSVSGTSPALVARLAALLNAEVIDTTTEAPASVPAQ